MLAGHGGGLNPSVDIADRVVTSAALVDCLNMSSEIERRESSSVLSSGETLSWSASTARLDRAPAYADSFIIALH